MVIILVIILRTFYLKYIENVCKMKHRVLCP